MMIRLTSLFLSNPQDESMCFETMRWTTASGRCRSLWMDNATSHWNSVTVDELMLYSPLILVASPSTETKGRNCPQPFRFDKATNHVLLRLRRRLLASTTCLTCPTCQPYARVAPSCARAQVMMHGSREETSRSLRRLREET